MRADIEVADEGPNVSSDKSIMAATAITVLQWGRSVTVVQAHRRAQVQVIIFCDVSWAFCTGLEQIRRASLHIDMGWLRVLVGVIEIILNCFHFSVGDIIRTFVVIHPRFACGGPGDRAASWSRHHAAAYICEGVSLEIVTIHCSVNSQPIRVS